GQDAQEHYEVKMKSDEQGRWQLVTERVAETSPETGGGALGGLARVYVVQDDAGDAAEVQTEALQRLLEAELSERATKETIEVLLKELAAQDAERAPVVRRKRFVFEGEPLEIDVDSLPEGKSQRRIYVRTDGDQRFGAIAVEPQDEPRQVRVDEDVWVQLGDEGHAIYSTQGGGQSGATIHALPSREGETRVRTERRVFVRGEDGALVELELRPDAPADPRAPEAPGAPAAPRVSLGFSGTPPQAGAPERKEVRWFDSSSAPQPSASSSTDRDELLREVHVLTKEMLAELKLLRAAVDDLRRDVDSHHRASGSGLR
ncbi:MAG: hypothetical protein KDC14_17355, partial [Planctomycetes bacterium]|nr:hypothetical protein [Planctomycetota bacterium]